MKFNKYKNILTVFVLAASVSVVAQKQSKDFTEKFAVNKDVKVEINASNAEINVSTWNKNEVLIQATIEIDGLTKKEAEKYLKNYQFEALGNSSKVKITAGGNNSFRFADNDFIIFNKDNFVMPDIVIPDFEMPEIVMPDMNITIPDIDFENIFIDLDDIEFDFDQYDKDGKDYFFVWKDNAKKIKIKSKKEWEDFKKTKEYKKWRKEMKANNEKIKKELAKARKEYNNTDVEKIIRESLEKAKKAMKEIDMDKIKKDFDKVRKDYHKNFKNSFIFDTGSDELIINDKKVKIKKKITIKVPKGATFDLNTRHCKVKLPKTKASGKVSYGSFDANGLDGGDLKIYYAPVNINTLHTTTLSLNNVTDAKIASVTNTTLTSDSGSLEVDEVFSNVHLESSFGELVITKLNSGLKNFNLILKQSEAEIDGKLLGKNFISVVESYGDKNDKSNFNGSFTIKSKKEGLVYIKGKYSTLKLTK